MNIKNPNGNPKNIPSNLSRIPPCPGRMLPVSFIFAFLFKYEKDKSPNWQPIDVRIPNKIILKFITWAIYENKINITKQDNIILPIDPMIVFFGLIFVNFGPLKILPKIKPPRSDAMQTNSKIYRITFKFKELEISKKK